MGLPELTDQSQHQCGFSSRSEEDGQPIPSVVRSGLRGCMCEIAHDLCLPVYLAPQSVGLVVCSSMRSLPPPISIFYLLPTDRESAGARTGRLRGLVEKMKICVSVTKGDSAICEIICMTRQ